MASQSRIEEGSAPAPSEGGLRRRVHQAGFLVLLAVVFFAPVPQGSRAPVLVATWAGLAGLALLLSDLERVSRQAAWILCGAFGLAAAYFLVAFLQMVVPALLPLDIWQKAYVALGETGASLSASVRDAPDLFLLRPLLCLTVFACAVIYGGESRMAGAIARAILLAACIGGLLGVVAWAFDIRALRPYEQGGSLTAFFVNRNSSATYLGSAFLLAFSILVARVRSALHGSSLSGALVTVFKSKENRLPIAASLLLLVLLPMTLSRAGLGLTVVVAVGTIALIFTRQTGRWWHLGVALLGVFAVVFVLSGQEWRLRQAQVGLESEARFIVYQIMIGSILAHPLLGLGLGTFPEAFPALRTDALGASKIWDLGHSTPLELAFEAGLPLVLLVGLFIALCGAVLVRGVRRRPEDPYVLAGLLVGVLGLAHSSIDFSLQMPGYAVIYMAIVGAGVARALLPAAHRRRRSSRASSRKRGEAPEAVPATSGAD